MTAYDQTYQTLHYFGKPYQGLTDFFSTRPKGSLVDLGAGQGRDSLALAAMGYAVTAVDVSTTGLAQLSQADPQIYTQVADLYTFNVAPYDYILMDSIVHFYKKDMEKESELVRRILTEMKPGAVFVNCLLKNKRAEKILKDIVNAYPVSIITEQYTDYPEFSATYHLLAVEKRGK